jgi:hypothetical protein
MSDEDRFSLIFWQETEQYKKEYGEAKEGLSELRREWRDKYGGDSYTGSLRFDSNGIPEFWINDFGGFHTGRFYGQRRNWSAKEALANSLKYGDSGWWYLYDLKDLIEGKGQLLEEAMFDCGFRRNKRDPEKWARVGKDDEDPYKTRWKMKFEKEHRELTGEELENLKDNIVSDNKSEGYGKTIDMQVGDRGMIYAKLRVNPFGGTRAETMPAFLAKITYSNGLIAKQQNGFQIEAENVRIGEDEHIYVKAVRPDNTYEQAVWPKVTPTLGFYKVADDLVSRVETGEGLGFNI